LRRRGGSAKVAGMFERFTDEARQVVVHAQDEARALGHTWIGTEHLLLGLLRGASTVAARVLEELEVEIDEVRAEVTRIVGVKPQSGAPVTGQIPFTPRAKKVLELSLREALSLGSRNIDTEHILLGLTRENDGVGAEILRDLAATDDVIRDRTVRQLSGRGRRRRARASGRQRTPDRWEYRIERPEPPDRLSTESLNTLGADGWELVAAVPAELGGGLVFKRRAHLPPEQPDLPASPEPETI
jgi:ATP-dependent Clp protease ATP-binding subunit ClpC